jgi:mRNA interferase MazF
VDAKTEVEMERGEIRWYTFAAPDKRRPVLILTRDKGVKSLNDITIAPLTTNVRKIASRVLLTPADGLPEACEVDLDHISTVPKKRIGAPLAQISRAKMHDVGAALLFALGFDD